MKRTFISYAHRDMELKNRLEVHLKPLVREKVIGAWSDSELKVGDELDPEVFKILEESDLYLALLSPDFLASEYCYDREFAKALELHEAGRLRIVPIILEQCDWLNTPFKRFLAAPQDGKAISLWSNQNEALHNVIQQVRTLVSHKDLILPTSPTPQIKEADQPSTVIPQQSWQPFKVKRQFDVADKLQFRKEGFATVRAYFERLVSQLNENPALKAVFEDMSSTAFTCTVVNKLSNDRSGSVTVHMGSASGAMGDIYYSLNDHAPASTANGIYSIHHTDFELFFTTDIIRNPGANIYWNAQTVASDIQSRFLERAGIELN